jgi:hypothetical protein
LLPPAKAAKHTINKKPEINFRLFIDGVKPFTAMAVYNNTNPENNSFFYCSKRVKTSYYIRLGQSCPFS